MNKKMVVIVVLAECILAIFLISFLGKAIENAMTNTLCRELCFVNDDGLPYTKDSVIQVTLSDTNVSYQLNLRISPTNTTNKSVTYMSSEPESVLVDNTGLVTFIDEVPVTITVKANDGSGRMCSITIVPTHEIHGNVDI